MMFNSRGFKKAAADKASELEDSLLEASEGGKLPIVIDTSPCLATIKGALNTKDLRYDIAWLFALPRRRGLSHNMCMSSAACTATARRDRLAMTYFEIRHMMGRLMVVGLQVLAV